MLNFLCNLRGFLQQDLLARFCKESSLAKQEMLPDIDHMDINSIVIAYGWDKADG